MAALDDVVAGFTADDFTFGEGNCHAGKKEGYGEDPYTFVMQLDPACQDKNAYVEYTVTVKKAEQE